MLRITFLASCCLALCSSVHAASDPISPVHKTFDWPQDPIFGTGSFTRAEAGYVSGDGRLHAVMQRDDKLTVMFQPNAFQAYLDFGYSVNDFDILPSGGDTPYTDAILSVGPDGLRRSYIADLTTSITSSLEDSGNWVGAILIRVGDVNDDGMLDAVGVMSDEKTIRTKLGQANGSFVDGSTFTLADSILHLEVLKWQPNQGDHVALLTGLGVYVYDIAGNNEYSESTLR